jgi:hypothetical protein
MSGELGENVLGGATIGAQSPATTATISISRPTRWDDITRIANPDAAYDSDANDAATLAAAGTTTSADSFVRVLSGFPAPPVPNAIMSALVKVDLASVIVPTSDSAYVKVSISLDDGATVNTFYTGTASASRQVIAHSLPAQQDMSKVRVYIEVKGDDNRVRPTESSSVVYNGTATWMSNIYDDNQNTYMDLSALYGLVYDNTASIFASADFAQFKGIGDSVSGQVKDFGLTAEFMSSDNALWTPNLELCFSDNVHYQDVTLSDGSTYRDYGFWVYPFQLTYGAGGIVAPPPTGKQAFAIHLPQALNIDTLNLYVRVAGKQYSSNPDLFAGAHYRVYDLRG